jgi:hypothetical protein
MTILILTKYKLQRLEQFILNEIKKDWNLCEMKIKSQFYQAYKLKKI